MKKSEVTEFFLDYFERNSIGAEWISEKTGIHISKLTPGYKRPLSAGEFMELCIFLRITPEEVREALKDKRDA